MAVRIPKQTQKQARQAHTFFTGVILTAIWGLITAALQIAGVISVVVSHVLLILAWIIGGLSIFLLQPQREITGSKIVRLVLLSIFFISLDRWMVWMQPKTQLSSRNREAYIVYASNPTTAQTAYLAVLFEIGNPGGKPSTARDFTLSVHDRYIRDISIDGDGVVQFMLDLPPGHTDMIFFPEELLQRRCSTSPIAPGASVRGWLLFEIPKSPDIAEVNPSITFIDIQDQLYSVPLQKIYRVPPLPPPDPSHLYPDITYPFREQSVIENMLKRHGSGKQ